MKYQKSTVVLVVCKRAVIDNQEQHATSLRLVIFIVEETRPIAKSRMLSEKMLNKDDWPIVAKCREFC